jgi:hypothetical protein
MSVLMNQDLATDWPMTLPQTGRYLLVVNGATVATPVPFTFRVVEASVTTTALTLGTVVAGTLAAPGAELRYTFSGSQGQRVFYDAIEGSPTAVALRVLDAEGRLVSNGEGNAYGDLGPLALPRAGMYTVAIGGLSDRLGAVSFRLLDVASAPVLAMGTDTTGRLVARWESRIYRFTGVRGQRVRLTTGGGDAGLGLWQWVDPTDTVLRSADLATDLGEFGLPMNGTYVVVVRPVESGENPPTPLPYTIRAEVVPDTPVAPAGFGEYSGSLAPGEGPVEYAFTATAGTLVLLDSLEPNSGSLAVDLQYGATTIWSGWPAAYDIGADNMPWVTAPQVLPYTGTYTLGVRDVEGGSGGNYRLRLLNLAADSTVLGWGVEAAGAIEDNSLRVYSFQANAGQRLYVDCLQGGTEAGSAAYRVARPSGQFSLGANCSIFGCFPTPAYMDGGPWTLTETGTYYLILNSWTGPSNYRLRILDGSGAGAIGYTLDTAVGPGAGATLGAYEAKLYRFDAAAGRRLFFDGRPPVSGWAMWWACEPGGANVGGANLGVDFETTVGQGGSQLAILSNIGDAEAPYSFRIVTPETSSPVLTPGPGLVTGTLAEPGSELRFTFNAAAGDRFYYDPTGSAYPNVLVTMQSPSGGMVFGGYSDADAGPFAIVETGTQTLTLHNGDSGPAGYAFRLLRVADATPLACDTENAGTLGPNEARLYRFEPMPGLGLFFDAMGPSDSANWSLYDPVEALLANQLIALDLGLVTPADAGTHVLVLRNSTGGTLPYHFRVQPGNHAPVVAAATPAVKEETALNFAVNATDAEQPNDQLSYTLEAPGPAGLTLDPRTGVVKWTPTEAQGPGTYTLAVAVQDDGRPSLRSTRAFQIQVGEVNRPPILGALADKTVVEGSLLTFTATASDPDVPANTLRFSLGAGAPANASIDPVTGVFAWTPREDQGPGTYTIAVTVSDSGSADPEKPTLSDTRTFQATVIEKNERPVIGQVANRTVPEGVLLAFAIAATDVDLPPNGLKYALTGVLPAGAAIDSANGAFTWTPAENQGPGLYEVTVTVTDSGSADPSNPTLMASQVFWLTVEEVNVRPVLTLPADQTIDELTTLEMVATATDSDLPRNRLTFSLVAPPAGATIDANTGAIRWVTDETTGPGLVTLTVRVVDDGTPALDATGSFRVTVREVNVAPKLDPMARRTVHAGQTLAIPASATDADLPKNTLTFSLVAPVPADATIDPVTGLIQWPATVGRVGGTFTFRVAVSDGATPSGTDQTAFAVTVAPELRIDTVEAVAGGVRLHWNAIDGHRYRVEWKSALNEAQWQRLGAPVTGEAGGAAVVDSTPGEVRFYRVADLE